MNIKFYIFSTLSTELHDIYIPENDSIHLTQQQNLEAMEIHEYKETHALKQFF
jgi:hypothetical protein